MLNSQIIVIAAALTTRRVAALFSFIVLSLTLTLWAQTEAGDVVYKVGGNVSPPRVKNSPDPGYTKEAQAARYQGVCVLKLIVGEDGRPRDITVTRRLGLGLDEKAIEAVKRWTFKPAMKGGKPVAVQISVEINFKLYDDPRLGPKPIPQPIQPRIESVEFTKEQLDQIHEQWRRKYSAEQLADLRSECNPFVDTKVEDLEDKKASLPPHECTAVLSWMRDLRVEALYLPPASKK